MWKRQSSKSTQPALPCVVDPIDSAEKDVPTYRSVQDFVNRICIYQGRATHRPLVLKQYHKPRMQPVHHQQVANEIAALSMFAGIRFTGVVGYYGTFDEGDGTFLVLEHCSGGSAFDHMRPLHSPTEEWLVSRVIAPLLMTLDVAHRRGYIHRDIKPEHCLFTADGAFRLADWGLAVSMGRSNATQPMPVVGTLDYLAPEVAGMSTRPNPLATYSPHVDVWAVGVLVWEALAGSPPFAHDDLQQTAHNIQYAPLTDFPASMSAACRDFVRRALCKHPDNRPSASELLQHPWLTPGNLSKQPGVVRQSSGDAEDTIAAVFSPGATPAARRMPPRAASSPNLLARNVLVTPPPSKPPAPTESLSPGMRLWSQQGRRCLPPTLGGGSSQPGSPLTPRRTASLWDSFRRLSARWRGKQAPGRSRSPRSPLGPDVYPSGPRPGPRHSSAPPDCADTSTLRGHALITPLQAAPRSRAKAVTTRSRFGAAPPSTLAGLQEVATPLELRFEAAA